MSELIGIHVRIDEPDEYACHLLTALLKKASVDVGKKLACPNGFPLRPGFLPPVLLTVKCRLIHDAVLPCPEKCAIFALMKRVIFIGNHPVPGPERQINQQAVSLHEIHYHLLPDHLPDGLCPGEGKGRKKSLCSSFMYPLSAFCLMAMVNIMNMIF
ncbi:hypothetical protein NPF69_004578 [Salmonella enterica]|nr:hypothetical protein [Salmonella enterica]